MQVVRNGAIYFGSSLVNKAIPFLLLPLFTSKLSPSEFGAMSIFLVMNGIVGAFVGMAMNTNIATNFFTESKGEIAAVVGNVVIIMTVTAGAAWVAATVWALARATIFSIPTTYLLVMPALAFMTMLCTLNTTILRSEGRARAYAAFEIGQMLVNVVVTVALLMWAGLGWRSQVIGLVAANVVFSSLAVLHMRKRGYIQVRHDKARVREILELSVPLVPHILGGVVIALSDRLFIERMVGLDAVGLYSVGYSFGMAMSLVTDASIKAWTPWVYKTLAEGTEGGKRQVVQSCYALVLSFIALATLVAAGAQWALRLLVSPAFHQASTYVGWITIGYAIRGIYQVSFPFLVHIRRTSFLAISTSIAAALNLLFNYLLIDRYGALGGAYATVIVFAASSMMVFWYQARKFPMPWLSGFRA